MFFSRFQAIWSGATAFLRLSAVRILGLGRGWVDGVELREGHRGQNSEDVWIDYEVLFELSDVIDSLI